MTSTKPSAYGIHRFHKQMRQRTTTQLKIYFRNTQCIANIWYTDCEVIYRIQLDKKRNSLSVRGEPRACSSISRQAEGQRPAHAVYHTTPRGPTRQNTSATLQTAPSCAQKPSQTKKDDRAGSNPRHDSRRPITTRLSDRVPLLIHENYQARRGGYSRRVIVHQEYSRLAK
jgi:hypothetical protein